MDAKTFLQAILLGCLLLVLPAAAEEPRLSTPRSDSGIGEAFGNPLVTREYFRKWGIYYYQLINSDGALELHPTLGIADIIVDLTSSGTTLKDNRLREIEEGTVLDSAASLIGHGIEAEFGIGQPTGQQLGAHAGPKLLNGIQSQSAGTSGPLGVLRIDDEHVGIVPVSGPGESFVAGLLEGDRGHRPPVIVDVPGDAPEIATDAGTPLPDIAPPVLA